MKGQSSLQELARVTTALVHDFSAQELLTHLAHPPFLSAWAAAIGLDWTTSGHTSIALDTLKAAIDQRDDLVLIGGRRKNLSDNKNWKRKFCFSNEQFQELNTAHFMTAKVDTCAVQEDTGQLIARYLVFDNNADWVVINQKIYSINHEARRYHWRKGKSFVDAPHTGIIGGAHSVVLDLTALSSAAARKAITDLAQEPVSRLNSQLAKVKAGQRSLYTTQNKFPKIALPKRFFPNYLAHAREAKPRTFEELLSVKGIGPGTIRGLTALSSVLYGTHPSYSDPRTHDWTDALKKSGCSSLSEYAQLFLEKVDHAKLGKRHRFEITERLNGLLGKRLHQKIG